LRSRVVKLSGFGRTITRFNTKRPAHPKMHDEQVRVVQLGDEIFGPPSEPDDMPSLQALRKPLRQGKAQVRAPLLDLRETGADHRRLEAAAHGFDFGQFGHELQLVGRDPAEVAIAWSFGKSSGECSAGKSSAGKSSAGKSSAGKSSAGKSSAGKSSAGKSPPRLGLRFAARSCIWGRLPRPPYIRRENWAAYGAI
jgi:hypothetical protein